RTEIPGPLVGRWQGIEQTEIGALAGALIAGKEEQPVFFDRSAKRDSVDVDDVLWSAGALEEKVPSLQKIALVVVERGAVEVIGPRLGLDGNGRTTRKALFSVRGVGGYIDHFDGLGSRQVHGVPELELHRNRSVNAGGVRFAAGSVHIRCKRPLGRIRVRIL